MDATQMLLMLLAQMAVLMVFGVAGCALAGRLGAPRLVGGVIGGVLLGPGVFGQIAPAGYEALIGAGLEARRELAAFEAEREQGRRRLDASGVSDAAIEEFDEETERLREARLARVERAREPMRGVGVLLAVPAIVFTLLGAGYVPRDEPGAGVPQAPGFLAGLRRSAVVGTAAVLGGGVVAGLFGWMLFALGWIDAGGLPMGPEVWLAGLVLGCAAASVPVSRRLLDRIESPLDAQRSGLIALVIALAGLAAGLAVWRGDFMARSVAEADAWRAQMVMLAPLIVVTLALILSLGGAISAPIAQRFRFRPATDTAAFLIGLGVLTLTAHLFRTEVDNPLFGILYLVVLVAAALAVMRTPAGGRLPVLFAPLLFALAGSRIEFAGFDWLLALLVLVAFGDGKALGATAGSMWFERRALAHALKLATAIAAGGAAPLAVALILRLTGAIDAPLFAALVLAVVVSACLGAPTLRITDAALGTRPQGEG